MGWKIYTKMVQLAGVFEMRWFWRSLMSEACSVSPEGFKTRPACTADAARNGCTGKPVEDHVLR
jgi:hypothetical protein